MSRPRRRITPEQVKYVINRNYNWAWWILIFAFITAFFGWNVSIYLFILAGALTLGNSFLDNNKDKIDYS